MSDKHGIIGIDPWLETPAGRYLLDWEQARLDAMVADIFGFHALQLGWPQVDVRYRSGTRTPTGATIHLIDRSRTPITIDVEVLGSMPLNVGCGYGGDPDWGHGQWRGRNWSERAEYDLTDPAVAGRVPFSVVDHVARATCNGQVGYGIFEHGTVGRHDPSGFTDLFSVAP